MHDRLRPEPIIQHFEEQKFAIFFKPRTGQFSCDTRHIVTDVYSLGFCIQNDEDLSSPCPVCPFAGEPYMRR